VEGVHRIRGGRREGGLQHKEASKQGNKEERKKRRKMK
jgi:hypothetical protein